MGDKRRVLELRMQGFGYKKISNLLKMKRDKVRNICLKNNLGGTITDLGKGICAGCGSEFKRKSTNHKFCSKKCIPAQEYVNVVYQCNNCKEKFIKKQGYDRSYCSRKCYCEMNTYKCIWCNGEFVGEKERTKKYCSKSCRSKHVGFLRVKRNLKKPKTENELKEYMKELLKIHNNTLLPASEFKGLCEPIKLVCTECGTVQEKSESRRAIGKNATGCSQCSASKGERKIKRFLDSHKINYKQEYSFEGLIYKSKLRFDFAIIHEDTVIALIEYDGIQHYEPIDTFGGEKAFKETIARDKIKSDFAAANNVKLIRIPYEKYDDLETVLLEKLLMEGG